MIFFYLILSFSLVNSSSVYLFFERTTIELSLSESIEIHSKLSSIQAQASSSLSIVYRLHGDTDQTFFLNTQTGELYLRKSLDYETQPIYKLTIEARAATATSIVAPCFTQLIIYIVNINDNPPDINLVIYPSVLYESDIIKYDLNSPLTHFATIYIKDLDESTENLTLTINNTDDFQVQLIRRMKTSLVYILSIRTHGQYLKQEDFYISMNTCDNDQPLLCTNRTYRFQFRSNEYLCNLSFNQKTYIIDIDEHLPNRSLIMKKMTNKFCENLTFSIDDNENFSMDFQTGDLYTLKRFNRLERSIYVIHLFINNLRKIKIIVRLLDQFGKIPFLFNKNLVMNVETFSTIQIFNSTFCRSQSMMENYFQLLSNCTIRSLTKPLPQGQYLFQIELFQHTNYRYTFLLELRNEQIYFLAFKQLQWFVIVSICLSMIGILGIILIIKYKRSRFNQVKYSLKQQQQKKKNVPFFSIEIIAIVHRG